MTETNWPPKVYNILTQHLNDPTIPHAVFRFYCKLLALAWGGEAGLRIEVDDLMTAVGLQRSAVFEYARSLQLHSALLWQCAGDVFECSFTGVAPESADPLRAESAYIDPLTSKTLKKTKRSEVKEDSAKSDKSGSADSQPKATTRQITDEYTRLLGHPHIKWAEGESSAAKWIGQRFTVLEFAEAYHFYKAQKFWQGKRLTLRYIQSNIADYFTSRDASAVSTSPTNAIGADDVRREFERQNPNYTKAGSV